MSNQPGTDPLRSPNRTSRRKAWRERLHAIAEHVSSSRIAEALSVSGSYVRQSLGARAKDADHSTGAALALDDLPALLSLGADGERIYDEVLAQLARLRGSVVRVEHVPAEDLGTDLANLSALQGATGRVVAELLGALADLRLDRGEAARVRPIIRDAIRCLHRWDAVLERVEREGVVAVRGIA